MIDPYSSIGNIRDEEIFISEKGFFLNSLSVLKTVFSCKVILFTCLVKVNLLSNKTPITVLSSISLLNLACS